MISRVDVHTNRKKCIDYNAADRDMDSYFGLVSGHVAFILKICNECTTLEISYAQH